MFNCLPVQVNRRVFTHLDYKQSQAFYYKIRDEVQGMHAVAAEVKANTISPTVFIDKIEKFMKQKPVGFTRILQEYLIHPPVYSNLDGKQPFIQDREITKNFDLRNFFFFGKVEYQTNIANYLIHEIVEVFPRMAAFLDNPAFQQYVMSKYGYMYRETIARCLRNKSFGRKSLRNFFKDLDILIGDGNYLDETLKESSNLRNPEPITDNLMLSITTYLDAMIEYLLKGFDLELYYPAELPEFFFQCTCAFEMLSINRQ